MTEYFQDFIADYLDEVLTDEKQAELEAWIRESPNNADQFAEAVYLENRLRAEVKAAPHRDKTQARRLSTPRTTNPGLWPRMVAGLAAAILIVAAGGLWFPQQVKQQIATEDPESPAETTFVSIVQIAGAEWEGDIQPKIGDRLAAGTIRLQSGLLRLAFDDGVEVTMQGPAEYELLNIGKTRLRSGLLTATVPPGTEGFTVDTPAAEVVDLGTVFGIDVREDGVSHVSVFEGEVEVSTPESASTKLLQGGEAVRIRNDETIEAVQFDPEPFSKIWPVASGIERSTEVFRIVPPWPPQQRFVRSDIDIFVVPEGHASTLSSLLSVNISEPGMYSHEDELTVSELSEGTKIRSFTIFFHPEKAGPRQRTKQISGSITFNSPVLGLICLHDELQASARRFVRKGPRNIREGQQLELTGGESSDVLTLSEDRRTISLELFSPGRSSELMRVIVDASGQSSETPGN